MTKHLTAYRVTAGTFCRDYPALHLAEQMARALRMHGPLAGVPVTVEALRMPDDPLTRMTWGAAVLSAGAL